MSANNMTGVMTFSGDTFRNNSAGIQGGVLAITNSPKFDVTITNSTFADNTVRTAPLLFSPRASHEHFTCSTSVRIVHHGCAGC